MSYRIVLDTNCIISALIFSRQKMAWLRHSWQSGSYYPISQQGNSQRTLETEVPADFFVNSL